MKTIREILPQAEQYLKERKISNAKKSAEEIIAFALKYKRLDLYMNFDCPFKEEELSFVRLALKKRGQGTPLEYILGETEFYGCKIFLTPDVLIPRPETEILVDLIAKRLKGENLAGKVLWDIACGSGCIGLALKKKFPELKVILSDLSEKALDVARKNASCNELDVSFLQGDLLEPFGSSKVDIVVSNPPYISQKEYEHLDREVREFEPKMALLSGETGGECYERLARGLPSMLSPHAKVFFEIGSGQGALVNKIFSASCWTLRQVQQDWAGHDRFFFLEFE